RRRHTSFSRDWSSDVCSSDLFLVALLAPSLGQRLGFPVLHVRMGEHLIDPRLAAADIQSVGANAERDRRIERIGGGELRPRQPWPAEAPKPLLECLAHPGDVAA